MMFLLLIVTLVLVFGLLPWFILLSAVLVAAAARRWGGDDRLAGSGPVASRFLIVIPAHDEAEVIGVTVRSCRAVDYPADQFQVFVIADNCTDETANLAHEAGAEVVVRVDLARKSKGFALEDFFQDIATHPKVRPYDAFVLVDADTNVAPNILHAFDQSLRRGDDFVQGYYTVRNADASWRTRLMTYAFSLANGVWLMGLDRLRLGVGLKGNGMCFRAAALARIPWQVHGQVEDMEYAWALRVAGERVRFQPLARVSGEMVSRGGSGAASQRRRWESGRKSLRASVRPRIWRSDRLSIFTKLAYQTDLSFPPLSRLVCGLSLVTILSVVGLWLSSLSPVWVTITIILAAEWISLTVYLVSPFVIMDLPLRYLVSLVHLPYYMLWKLSVGRLKRPDQWVRTPREVSSESS